MRSTQPITTRRRTFCVHSGAVSCCLHLECTEPVTRMVVPDVVETDGEVDEDEDVVCDFLTVKLGAKVNKYP